MVIEGVVFFNIAILFLIPCITILWLGIERGDQADDRGDAGYHEVMREGEGEEAGVHVLGRHGQRSPCPEAGLQRDLVERPRLRPGDQDDRLGEQADTLNNTCRFVFLGCVCGDLLVRNMGADVLRVQDTSRASSVEIRRGEQPRLHQYHTDSRGRPIPDALVPSQPHHRTFSDHRCHVHHSYCVCLIIARESVRRREKGLNA